MQTLPRIRTRCLPLGLSATTCRAIVHGSYTHSLSNHLHPHLQRACKHSDSKRKPIADSSSLFDSNHGLTTFANLPFYPVLSPQSSTSSIPNYDIAILGAPFDLGTTYRPGSRFGPQAIRKASQTIYPAWNYSVYSRTNVFTRGCTIIDVGDALLTPFDKDAALDQLTLAHKTTSTHTRTTNATTTASSSPPPPPPPPRILTLGGDHLTTLVALRNASQTWGPVAVIHLDSHIDTWDPQVMLGSPLAPTKSSAINHGTFLHIAHAENLLAQDASIHLGIRAPLTDATYDLENDARCGFTIVTARNIDRLGVAGVVDSVKRRVGARNVYVSVDIDVLDPAFAPGTGTPEVGGWSTREVLGVLDGLRGAVGVVGADVVEVAPAYGGPGEVTGLAAVQIVVSLLGLMVDGPAVSVKK